MPIIVSDDDELEDSERCEAIEGESRVYRIEKRGAGPTEYWAQSGMGNYYWNPNESRAEIFTESERHESLMQFVNGGKGLLPPDGIWVVLNNARKHLLVRGE